MEGKTYWKILLLMKRKPGISMEEFRNYYENNHVPLELPYDVVTEMWFDNEEGWKGTLDYITTTVMPDEVVQDELNFFHRPTMRIATVVECDSVMSPEGTPIV
jgi:hypothetical protein